MSTNSLNYNQKPHPAKTNVGFLPFCCALLPFILQLLAMLIGDHLLSPGDITGSSGVLIIITADLIGTFLLLTLLPKTPSFLFLTACYFILMLPLLLFSEFLISVAALHYTP